MPLKPLYVLFAAASASLPLCFILWSQARCLKPGGRKRHCSEQVAGVLVGFSGIAFLIGNAVIGGLYEELCRSFYPYDREKTEGDVKSRTVVGKRELAVDAAPDTFRDLIAITGIAALLYLISENDRLNRLNYCNRSVVSYVVVRAGAAIAAPGA